MFSKFTRFLPNPLSHIISISHSHYDLNEYNKHVGEVMTKETFFKTFPDYQLVQGRVNLANKGYNYKWGLNVIDHFKPSGHSQPGGFYLTDATKLHNFLTWGKEYNKYEDLYGDNVITVRLPNIITVSLPDDALIYLEHDQIKVDKLVLHESTSTTEYYDHLTEQEQLKCIQENPYVIKFISHPSDELQIKAIALANNPVIRCINNLSYNAAIFAVSHDGDALAYMKNPKTLIQLKAVKRTPLSIRHIRFPCKEVQLEAVEHDVNAIYYIQGVPHIAAILLAIKLYITK